jgi:two-component system phosphate regulon sensor histidine kinase PhoR
MAVEAERMRVLIDDLLSLSKVEEMERVQPSTIVNLNEIIRSVILSLAPLSQEADVPIHFENAVDPLHVQGDDGQLRQVFMNLIGNAIKYAPSKQGITIQTQHIAQDLLLRSPAYQITVADFGDGIAAHHIARLTERFYRVDTHRSRAVGGTGLGLAIVKHIINRHRGRLNITSTEGKGSRFTIILPQRRDTNTL